MNRIDAMQPGVRRMRRGLGFSALVAGALLLVPPPAAGQVVPTSTDSSSTYEREVFDYPAAGRRNPFRALNAGQRIGPRFEDLRLNGVLYAPETGSVATLTDQKTGKRYRARAGEVLGEIRVAEIRPEEVVFVITSFGINRREVLRVKKDQEEEIEG